MCHHQNADTAVNCSTYHSQRWAAENAHRAVEACLLAMERHAGCMALMMAASNHVDAVMRVLGQHIDSPLAMEFACAALRKLAERGVLSPVVLDSSRMRVPALLEAWGWEAVGRDTPADDPESSEEAQRKGSIEPHVYKRRGMRACVEHERTC